MLPVSYGEAADKIAILRIKQERIADAGKLANVVTELNAISDVFFAAITKSARFDELFDGLRKVNEQLWDIEDDIRDCERDGDFGPKFVELARSVYVTNDERARLKKDINLLLGSALVEEKSYKDYKAAAPAGA
jgi:hypothetical protein